MIFDSINNRKQYAGIHEGIDRMLEVMKDYTPDRYPEEDLFLDGDNLFMMFENYETHSRDDAKMEAHQKYIDVMYMVEGSETIYVKPIEELKDVIKPYDPAEEAMLAKLDEDTTAVRMEPGRFVILFPQDAHAPACNVEGQHKVKKIIGKVRI